MLAVCYDWRKYYIPNWLIGAGYGIGFFYRSLTGGITGSIFWLLDALFPIMILFIFFYCKMLGAGDIKLFSVISGVSGVYSMIDVMTVSLFFGALLSVIFLIRHRNLRSRLQYLAAYFSKIIIKKEILPYAQQIRKRNTEAYHEMSRTEHIKRGHIHYSAAILYAVIFCRMSK
jgi:prepilin peptidase CpaA